MALGGALAGEILVRLDAAGAFRFQRPLASGTWMVLDPCGGAVIASGDASTTTPSITVSRLAP